MQDIKWGCLLGLEFEQESKLGICDYTIRKYDHDQRNTQLIGLGLHRGHGIDELFLRAFRLRHSLTASQSLSNEFAQLSGDLPMAFLSKDTVSRFQQDLFFLRGREATQAPHHERVPKDIGI